MGERLPLRDVVGVQMVSSYILIPTAVTTAHGPVGQEIITVRAKQASKRTRFTTVEYWSPRIFKIMFMGGFWAQPTVKPRGTCARRGVEIAFHFLNFTVISFFMAGVGKSAKTRSSSSDIQILVNDAIWTLPGQLVFLRPVLHFALSLCLCALVIWPSRLSSHCEAEEQKDGSNSLCAMPQAKATPPLNPPHTHPAHYLQTRLCISAGRLSLPVWPGPTVLRGRVRVSGRPTLDSVGSARTQPGHSTPRPGKQHKQWRQQGSGRRWSLQPKP